MRATAMFRIYIYKYTHIHTLKYIYVRIIMHVQMYKDCTQPNLLSFRIFAPLTQNNTNADYYSLQTAPPRYCCHLWSVIVNVGQSMDQSTVHWIRINFVDQGRSSMHPGDDCRTTLTSETQPRTISHAIPPPFSKTLKKKGHRKLRNFSFRVTGPCNLLGGCRDYRSEHTASNFKWPIIIDPECSSKPFTAMYQINFRWG